MRKVSTNKILLKGWIGLMAMLGVSVIFWSCAPDSGFNSVEDYDIVVTFYDPDIDYGAFETYAMPDSVVHLGDTEDIITDYDDLILDEVAENFESYGYTEESNPLQNPPDVVVLVSALGADWTTVTTYDWWAYWGWYPGWGYYPYYGAGWGMYYPYPAYSVTSYSTGSILIEMYIASEPIVEEERLPAAWTAIINGLMEGSSAGIQVRITDRISQAFEQSPYLRTN